MTNENEIDRFIKDQKDKLSRDLNDQKNIKNKNTPDRKQWNKASGNINIAEERPRTPAQAASLQFGNASEENKRRLQAERQREYNEFLAKHTSQNSLPQQSLTSKDNGFFPSPTRNEIDQNLLEERNREYNQLIEQRSEVNTRKPPSRGDSQSGFLSKFGTYEKDRKKLDEIRKNEYNSLIAGKKNANKKYGDGSTNNQSQLTPGREVPILRAEARQEELFKDFLNSKYGNKEARSPRHENNARQVENHQAGTLTGLSENDTAQQQKRIQRNQEYNEMLRRKGMSKSDRNVLPNGVDQSDVRKMSTPIYEELLEQKRREENRYRRYDDPEYVRPGVDSMTHGRDNIEAERNLDDLDREYESRKSRFESERAMNGDWQLNQPITMDFYNSGMNGRDMSNTEVTTKKRSPPQQQTYKHSTKPPPGQYKASLSIDKSSSVNHIGHDEHQSDRRKKQEQYRHDLEQQISEKNGKRRGRPGPASNNVGSERTPGARTPPLPTHRGERINYSPRSEPPSRKPPVANGYNSGGVLERGWEGMYEPSRLTHRPIPPELNYQPSAYMNSEAFNSIDEAYRYYGTKNPLDASEFGLPPTLQTTQTPRAASQPQPTVSFQPPPNRNSINSSPERQQAYQFSGDDRGERTRGRAEAQEYQRELQRQIMEKQMENQKNKEEQSRYDRKLEEEVKKYNPFGRGGGGAPIRDDDGNLIVDLRGVKPGHQTDRSQRPSTPVSQQNTRPAIDDPSLLPPSQTTATGDPTYARGGHGIFGVPKTENEKKSSDKYKDELRIQIEDKRKLAEFEKEKIRKEEEFENEKLRKEQEIMKHEYQKEQMKAKAKEEELHKRNEELRKMAEDKRRVQDETKKQEDEKSQKILREQQEQERERNEREEEQRAKRASSPPIPAVKTKLAVGSEFTTHRVSSPPIPTLKHKEEKRHESRPHTRQMTPTGSDQQSRAGSANILNQLAAMKKQLQTERHRVENALVQQQDDYEVYDPRLSQKPTQKREAEIDIFEGARNKAAVSVKRPADASKDFTDLKHNDDTVSRRSFRAKYPHEPQSQDALEIQQNAMIEQQERRLKNLKQESVYEKALPKMNPKDLGMVREHSLSPQSMLQSETAFIDMNGMNSFPDDFEDLPRKDSLARQKRRQPSKPSTPAQYTSDNVSLTSNTTAMGSTLSLNVDKMSKKNEERLRRLKEMSAGDDISIADPDDVLDRFMAKQNHRRPSSGQTLNDDTWMQAGMASMQQ